jgi:DNA-binding response OmpR family regulator
MGQRSRWCPAAFEAEAHAYRLAADGYIVKPIERRALVEQLLPVRRRGSRG